MNSPSGADELHLTSSSDRAAIWTAVLGLLACAVLGFSLYRGTSSVVIAISAVGSLASFVGLLVVAIQLVAVRRVSVAAASAAAETRQSITTLVALADITKTIKLVEQVQNDAGFGKYDVAWVRLQDVRANLVLFQPSIARLGPEEAAIFERLLANTGVDLLNLYNAVHGSGKPFNASRLARSLEDLIALLLRAERHMKFQG